MRNILIILFLANSFCVQAKDTFVGVWEGFKHQGHDISSHLLVIDSNNMGFYIYTIGSAHEENLFAKLNLNGIEFKNGYAEIKLSSGKINSTLICSKAMVSSALNCLTTFNNEDGTPIFSTHWSLVKSESGKVKNIELYKFAKALYNKSLKQDK